MRCTLEVVVEWESAREVRNVERRPLVGCEERHSAYVAQSLQARSREEGRRGGCFVPARMPQYVVVPP